MVRVLSCHTAYGVMRRAIRPCNESELPHVAWVASRRVAWHGCALPTALLIPRLPVCWHRRAFLLG